MQGKIPNRVALADLACYAECMNTFWIIFGSTNFIVGVFFLFFLANCYVLYLNYWGKIEFSNSIQQIDVELGDRLLKGELSFVPTDCRKSEMLPAWDDRNQKLFLSERPFVFRKNFKKGKLFVLFLKTADDVSKCYWVKQNEPFTQQEKIDCYTKVQMEEMEAAEAGKNKTLSKTNWEEVVKANRATFEEVSEVSYVEN